MSDKRTMYADTPSVVSERREPNPRQRILVAEDDPAIRQVNTQVLTYSGYHVDAAEDGAAAWDALEQNNYDLLVTDNDMPKVTGVELLQKMLDARKTLPVIMATGALPLEKFTECPALQPKVILLKPYTFEELLAAVKEVLRLTSDARNEPAPPPDWSPRPRSDRLRL